MTGIDSPRDVSYWLRELQEVSDALGSQGRADVRQRQATYLAAFVRTGAPTVAAGEAEITRSSVGRWSAVDQVFHECRDMAKEAYSDLLVAEMTRRGRDGNVVKIYDKFGVEVGEERKYSDYLIAFALKGLDSGSRWTQRAEAGAKNGAWRADLVKALSDPKAREALDQLADVMAGKDEGDQA